MKNILLFGAGKSASVLIEYLTENAVENNWFVTIVDTDKNAIEQKTKKHPSSSAIAADITNDMLRSKLIENCDLVISMMPPFLHILVAKDCLLFGKHLLTASYADDAIKNLANEAAAKGIIFLCEMGLDPGIDHMSAMKLIDEIKNKGGKIIIFKSHCGGLVAPENDDNPWHYKISWNPRNVVLAGKAGAEYLLDGNYVKEKYEQLFNAERFITVADEQIGKLSFYPNRNSLSYVDLYELQGINTFMRTTLRHKEFMEGWQHIINLQLTDETVLYQSDDLTIKDFFELHFATHEIKIPANELLIKQLLFLGLEDDKTFIDKGMISPADGLQFAMEKKLILHPTDKDLIVMQHEIEYSIGDKLHQIQSSIIIKGKDSVHTSMAKTVGLPLGIAAKLILNRTITVTGLQIPIIKEIYLPVLEELAKNDIVFDEVEM